MMLYPKSTYNDSQTEDPCCMADACAGISNNELLPGGELFQGVFFWLAKIGGGEILVLLLRNERKIWYKGPCCCILVDGFAVRDMWKPLVAEKKFSST